MRKFLIKHMVNFSLLSLALIFSAVFAEFILRLIFAPVNFLAPYMVFDEILGHRIAPNSGGHDSWGYRNKEVPGKVDIVTIGDSQTYGVSAPADHSWPSILQRFTQKKVYNLALGGYGPPQYYYLLKNYALKLNPSIVITGLYFGNDFVNSYELVYGNNYWEHLRDRKLSDKKFYNNTKVSDTEGVVYNKPLNFFRDFLAHNSVFYRLLTFYIGNSYRSFETKFLKQKRSDTSITILNINSPSIQTAFSPALRLKVEDLDDERIQEGIRISLKLFSEMNDFCKKNNIKCMVVLIPTKENVFAKYLENNKNLENSDIIDKLIDYENKIHVIVRQHFQNIDIPYLEALYYLRDAVDKKQIYPSNHDGHPNKNGYEVMASAVHQLLLKTEYLTKESN